MVDSSMESGTPQTTASKFADYSMQRIDLLTITLSGAGIYAVWEIFKYAREHKVIAYYDNLFWASIWFLSCAFLNFTTQYLSFYLNMYPKSFNERVYKACNYIIHSANIISALIMFIGFILVGYFCAMAL